MKRLHLTLIVALFLCTIAYANEKDIKVGGFHYRILNDNEVAVIGTEINDTVIRIPSTVSITNKQYAVVEIANKKPEKEGKNWAYYKNQNWGASTIDIIVPQSVKNIKAGAFYYNSFRNIYLPEEMECISPYAFYHCQIGCIRFPKHIRDFHDYAFEDSYIRALDFRETQYSKFDINWLGTIGKFDALFLPRSIEKLKDTSSNPHIHCRSESLILDIDGKTLKEAIEHYDAHTLFESVKMLAIRNIEKIDFRVSDNFPNLKEVYLPDPIREIGKDAFSNYGYKGGQLEKVYLNDNIEKVTTQHPYRKLLVNKP